MDDTTATPTRLFIDGRPHWLFPDGTTLPVVSGGDGPEDDPVEDAPAADTAADTPPADVSADADTDPAPADVDADFDATPDDALPDMLPRAAVVKARKDAQRYRERAKTYEEAFDGIDEADRGFFLDLAAAYKQAVTSGDTARALELADHFRSTLTPAEQAAVTAAAAADPPTPGDDRPLTRAELDAYLAEKEAAKAAADAEAKALQDIHDEAKTLGYEPDTVEYRLLLTVATTEPAAERNLAKAHDILKAREQAAIDAYVARQQAEANGTVTPTPRTGGAVDTPGPPKTLEEAKAAMRASLDAKGYPDKRNRARV